MARLGDLLKVIMPRSAGGKKGGVADTTTFNRSSPDAVLARPSDREHLNSLLDRRLNVGGAELMAELFRSDSDVSATVNAFLTVADTKPRWVVRDPAGVVDRAGQEIVDQIIQRLVTRFDYTKPRPFALKPSLRGLFESMRYMILLRGALPVELVFDQRLVPGELRMIDPQTLEWTEPKSGQPIPEQVVNGERTSLDIPTFFISHFRKDPTRLYSQSFFMAAINTIAARQQVINDMYSIMRKTGFPRMTARLLEEVLRKNAPAKCKEDETEMRRWLTDRRNELQQQLTNMSPEQALVSFDSTDFGILNEKNPAAGIDITSIIKVLNEANQAALKTMSTIIGRGETGVNTASVEARIFSMNAEQINRPIEDVMSQALTLALRLTGSQSRVEFSFAKVEMRPDLELEPQKTMRQARLMEQLSLGIINDDEYHMEMFGHIRPDYAPELAGTNFLTQNSSIDVDEVSPNGDPLGRSLAPEGSSNANSDTVRRNQQGSED